MDLVQVPHELLPQAPRQANGVRHDGQSRQNGLSNGKATTNGNKTNGVSNGNCNKLVALCEDGSLWEQWHSIESANVPDNGEWFQIHSQNIETNHE